MVVGSQLAESAHGATVYDLEVQDDHTYFVGAIGGGVWVHNDCTSIARELQAKNGGDIYELTPKEPAQFVDRAVEPKMGNLNEDGNVEPWNNHRVLVKGDTVYDPMMTGSSEGTSMGEWQSLWNGFQEYHNFAPLP